MPLVLVKVLLYVRRNRRLIRDGGLGRPPRLSHSSWALVGIVTCEVLRQLPCCLSRSLLQFREFWVKKYAGGIVTWKAHACSCRCVATNMLFFFLFLFCGDMFTYFFFFFFGYKTGVGHRDRVVLKWQNLLCNDDEIDARMKFAAVKLAANFWRAAKVTRVLRQSPKSPLFLLRLFVGTKLVIYYVDLPLHFSVVFSLVFVV